MEKQEQSKENLNQESEDELTQLLEQFNSKKLIIISAIIAVLIIAGCISAYFLWPKVEEATEEVITEDLKDETIIEEPADEVLSDWKTYRNEEYGFEFRYPEEWNLETEDDTGVLAVWLNIPQISLGENVLQNGTLVFVAQNLSDIEPEILGEFKKSIEEKSDGFIGGLPSVTSVDIKTDTGYRKVVEFVKKDKFFSISSQGALRKREDLDLGEFQKTYNQILSTFKFIE